MTGPFQAPPLPEIRRRPPRGRVLVVAPHPDDETMGVGGTLAWHRLAGDPISALYVCNGIQGDPDAWYPREGLVQQRQDEARRAAEILGIGELRFLDYPDNLSDADLRHVFPDLPEDLHEARRALCAGFAEQLGTLLDQGTFEIVYYPWPGELNGDHWLVGQAVSWLRSHRPDLDQRISWLGFEVWSACSPETVVDVSDTISEKLRAISVYESQELYVDYTHPALGIAAYRSLLLPRGATFGEAFVGTYRVPEME